MKECIKKLKEHIYGYDQDGNPELVGTPTLEELTDKINEIIDYLNMVISVGMLPYPEGYNWREEENE